MNRSVYAALQIAVITLLLAGCGTFSPRPDPSRFFTLSSLPEVEQARLKNSTRPEKMFLGIGPIKFPSYLDRQEIVVRTAQNRFEVSEHDRWAEPLQENFSRVLSENLALLLDTDLIIIYPWSPANRPSYQVEIEVLRLEANSERNGQLFARWSILDSANKKVAVVKESRVTRNAKEKSTDGSVAALSEAVGDLSREIAAAVSAINGRRG
ncbi:MAG TPA: PqiC family protein [Candidatus Nitrosocosmicus sp.]|nr:PqiC family protein [Candidatus Nitrosocosmicus sp.]